MTKRKAEEYEYEPHGVFGAGHSVPLGPASKQPKPKPMGFLAAHRRAQQPQKPPTRRR